MGVREWKGCRREGRRNKGTATSAHQQNERNVPYELVKERKKKEIYKFWKKGEERMVYLRCLRGRSGVDREAG